MKQNKNRPYVVCHILSALDGNISGSYFMMPELQPVQEAFTRIRADYQCDAYLAGAVTAASIYADGFLDEEGIEELVADPQAQHYAVIIDTEGSLRWNKGHIKRAGMPELHMIEVLTENVPAAFSLLDVRKVEGDGIWLRYVPKNRR